MGLSCVCVEYMQPLSEEIHFKDDKHNSDYDHEAFLGEDVKRFGHMPADESKKQLGYDVAHV